MFTNEGESSVLLGKDPEGKRSFASGTPRAAEMQEERITEDNSSSRTSEGRKRLLLKTRDKQKGRKEETQEG